MVAAGTGGHIMPGLAIAKVLHEKNIDVSWVGTPTGMENNLVPASLYKMFHLDFQGLRGKSISSWFFLPIRLFRAVRQSMQIIKKLSPQLILGMGGYVCFPIAIAAKIKKVKLVIHEANFIVGTANKYISPFADVRLCGFNGTIKNSINVGNPVNEEFFSFPSPQTRAKNRQDQNQNLQITVIGGSLGAQAFNEIMPKAMLAIVNVNPHININILHQCGRGHLDQTIGNYQTQNLTSNINWQVKEFINDMPKIMADSDLLICRSGALTVSEVAAVGAAAVFVPFPFAVDDHQSFNADYLAKNSAAFKIPQALLSAEKIAELIISNSREKLAQIGESARSYAMPMAAKKVAELCQKIINGEKYEA